MCEILFEITKKDKIIEPIKLKWKAFKREENKGNIEDFIEWLEETIIKNNVSCTSLLELKYDIIKSVNNSIIMLDNKNAYQIVGLVFHTLQLLIVYILQLIQYNQKYCDCIFNFGSTTCLSTENLLLQLQMINCKLKYSILDEDDIKVFQCIKDFTIYKRDNKLTSKYEEEFLSGLRIDRNIYKKYKLPISVNTSSISYNNKQINLIKNIPATVMYDKIWFERDIELLWE